MPDRCRKCKEEDADLVMPATKDGLCIEHYREQQGGGLLDLD